MHASIVDQYFLVDYDCCVPCPLVVRLGPDGQAAALGGRPCRIELGSCKLNLKIGCSAAGQS
jgi:hypothetical protein